MSNLKNLNDKDTNLCDEMEMAPLRIITQQTENSNVHYSKNHFTVFGQKAVEFK